MKATILRALGLVGILILGSCTPEDTDETNFQARYTGTWTCEEKTGINAPQFYEVRIDAGSDETEIIINNLYNSPTTLTANISEWQLSIPAQSSNGINFNGSGSANSDFQQINLTFTANDAATADNVEAVLRPKN